MAKKKTNPKMVSKKTSKAKSLGTARGNKTRKKEFAQYLRDYGHVVKPERIRKQFYRRGDEKTDKAIGETEDHQHNLRVPSQKFAPKWMSEPLRRSLLALVRNNRDRIFGRGGLLEDAITNTNGKSKSLGDGLVYVNMNKDADMRREMSAKGGENRQLRINAESINAFNDYAKAKKTFKDASGRKIAVPTTMNDIKKTLTKLLYLIPFGPDGKTF